MFATLAAAPVQAANWQLIRFEGRDYVSLENIAEFYGFPAPAPLPVISPVHAGAPPSKTTSEPSSSAAANSPSTTPTTGNGAPSASLQPVPPVLPKSITLTSDKWELEVGLNSREVMINGVKQWLAFPAVVHDNKVLISRLDLSKVVEPRLRPEMIPGFTPVSTIVLDPGHGGHDKGAISKYGYEKDFALDVSLRARKLLEARGYKVAMTRTTDVFVPLHNRPRLAKSLRDS
ncbi:MAG TPA: N-acetylmuramoyl-L-alanine amidase, partial [Chthoniobacteraceae bacterium]|nr:N-acetylmuramoyl-L-alanine amidase [Chthoniobacteraceae bacterium]